MTNAMSVDVEDYFQVSAFDKRIERTDWDNHPCRVERNTDAVLQMFADHGVQATFFTLGWIARRYPALVRRIVSGRHELASHGFDHVRVSAQTAVEFRRRRTADQGLARGYRRRAGRWLSRGELLDLRDHAVAFEVLADAGYSYSSSIYPIRHDHYGMPTAPRFAHRPDPSVPFVELPVSTVSVQGRNLPCCGGGYFRLLPYRVSRWAMRRVQSRRWPALHLLFPSLGDRSRPTAGEGAAGENAAAPLHEPEPHAGAPRRGACGFFLGSHRSDFSAAQARAMTAMTAMTAHKLEVRLLDDRHAGRWDAFVDAHPGGTFFHLSGWKRVIEESLGHRCYYFGSIRELYVFVIECLERQGVGLWTSRVSRCGFRRRAG